MSAKLVGFGLVERKMDLGSSYPRMKPVDSFYGPSKVQIPFVELAGRYASEKPIYSLTKGKYLSK